MAREAEEQKAAAQFKVGNNVNATGTNQHTRTVDMDSSPPSKRDTKAKHARSTVGRVAAEALAPERHRHPRLTADAHGTALVSKFAHNLEAAFGAQHPRRQAAWRASCARGRRNLPDAWKIELELGNKEDLAELGRAKKAKNGGDKTSETAKAELSLADNSAPEPKHDTRKEIAKAAGVSTGKVAQAERHRHRAGEGGKCQQRANVDRLTYERRRFPKPVMWVRFPPGTLYVNGGRKVRLVPVEK